MSSHTMSPCQSGLHGIFVTALFVFANIPRFPPREVKKIQSMES